MNIMRSVVIEPTTLGLTLGHKALCLELVALALIFSTKSLALRAMALVDGLSRGCLTLGLGLKLEGQVC